MSSYWDSSALIEACQRLAAEKLGANKLLTLDKNDFNDLTKVEIEQV